jgi:dolichyl-phosphate-mannose-protein mannosyltransferase
MSVSDMEAHSRLSPAEARDSAAQSSGAEIGSRAGHLLVSIVLVAGFAVRFMQARSYFLDPDEALHNLLASQNSLRLTYRAAFTQSHPPLLILFLHYWRWLGQSELILRLPSILAGLACCWLVYLWLRRSTDRSTALVGLLLVTFAPALIELSVEIRQYALLLMFMAACLYFSERAIQENSLLFMSLFSLSLYGALLVHYSALLFAFVLGVYMLVRLYPYGTRRGLFAVWAAGQIMGVALSGYFVLTHVAYVRQIGMMRSNFDTYLKRSIFHPEQNHVASFIGLQTLRVFTYVFSHGVVGTLALLAFATGLIVLFMGKARTRSRGPSPRQLALLLGLPFVLNCVAAFAQLYPYGGTRHAAVLTLFATAGVCFGLSFWNPARTWAKPLVVVLALAVCNIFPSPPPLIRARNHKKVLMENAVVFLRQSAPPGSVMFSDSESGLLLGYYMCGQGVVQVFPPFEPFSKTRCGPYSVVASYPGEWKFYADDLADRLSVAAKTYQLRQGTKIWLFDAGWITDSTPALKKVLPQLGCTDPYTFGENILVCELRVR